MKTYILTFKLTKHRDARRFMTRVVANDSDDIQGIKEERAMHFEKLYRTPVKCVKVEEVSDFPEEENHEREEKGKTETRGRTG